MTEPDPDPYTVLGVASDASSGTIRNAYRELARGAHPDLVGDGGLELMQRLNAAWAILGDAGQRAAHDLARAASGGRNGISGPDAPQWTGAAGRPPGRPSGSLLEFGLYAGWTLGEIARRDNGYLLWLADRPEGRPFSDEIRALLDAHRPAPPAETRRKGLFGR